MRPPHVGLALAFAVAALAAAACDKAATPAALAPAPIDVTGTWTGDLTFQGAAARIRWTLTQADTSVSGPVLLSLPSGTVLLNGFLTGTLTGSSLPYTISVAPGGIPAQPACTGQLAGTMTVMVGAASTMTGPISVTSASCPIPFPTTTLALTRQ